MAGRLADPARSTHLSSPPSPDPTSVYRYYDDLGILIYVGITRQGMGRNLQHNRNAEWWQYVTRQEVEHLPTRAAALAREKRLINEHRPPFNRQHNPGYQLAKMAYLAFRNRPRAARNAHARYIAAAKRLDCVIHEANGQEMVLRTGLIDTELATTVEMREPRPVYLADVTARTQRKIGVVERIEIVTPFLYAYCHFTTRKIPSEIERARIHLSWQQIQQPWYPYVRQVKLYLPGAAVEP